MEKEIQKEIQNMMYGGGSSKKTKDLIFEIGTQVLNKKTTRIKLGEKFTDVPSIEYVTGLEKAVVDMSRRLALLESDLSKLLISHNKLTVELNQTKERVEEKLDKPGEY